MAILRVETVCRLCDCFKDRFRLIVHILEEGFYQHEIRNVSGNLVGLDEGGVWAIMEFLEEKD